jgi:hypothetical protein
MLWWCVINNKRRRGGEAMCGWVGTLEGAQQRMRALLRRVRAGTWPAGGGLSVHAAVTGVVVVVVVVVVIAVVAATAAAATAAIAEADAAAACLRR